MAETTTPTKSRILDVSRSLFSAHGFENTTLDDIITACGVTKGAFYHYFRSKEILCENVIDQAKLEYEQLIASVDKSAEPIEQLRQLVGKIIELNTSGEWVNCRLFLRLSLESHIDHPEIQSKLNDFWQWCAKMYEDLIESCREAGQIGDSLSKEVQCQMLLSSIMGVVVLGAVNKDIEINPEMAEVIIKGLG